MLSIIKLRVLRLRDDVMVFVLMTAMALGFTAIFGASFDSYKPSVVIVDEDKSFYSEYFIDELEKNKSYNFTETDRISASKEVEEGRVLVALIVHKGFHDGIEAGNEISLGVMKVKDDVLILSLQETVSGIVLKMSGGIKIAGLTADFIHFATDEANIEEIRESAYNSFMESWKFRNPISVTSTVAATGAATGYNGLKHSMIGFTLFFSMYTMVFAIGTILSDKQYKTWERMLISPVSKTSILGGSMIVAYLTGAVQMGLLIACGKYLLKIDWGSSMAGVLLVSAAFVFAVTSLGLMMSGFIKTQGQLGSMAPIILTSTSMLGGCMWPLEIVNNKILLFLAELTPQKWAMQGIESIASNGMGFEAAVLPSGILLLMGIIYFTVGVKALNK